MELIELRPKKSKEAFLFAKENSALVSLGHWDFLPQIVLQPKIQ